MKYLAAIIILLLLGCSAPPPEQPSSEVSQQMSGANAGGEGHPGAALFTAHCSSCHDVAVNRAPHRSFLQMMAPDMLLSALNEGVMQQQAGHLSAQQKQQIVEFLAGTQPANLHKPVQCGAKELVFDYSKPPLLRNWGMTLDNRRFIPAEIAGLRSEDVPRLKLKWAFAYPHATRARSQPGFAGGALYVGSQDGTVYSINAESGCIRWTYRAGAEVRTGITIRPWTEEIQKTAPPVGFFADLVARVYALNLVTGEELWQLKIDDHPNATVTAQPVYHEGVLYVPVSSLEVVPAADPLYPCCSFRGAVVALDADSGEIRWKRHTIIDQPRQVGTNSAGTPIMAPSGAPVWNSPTIDPGRGLLYVGTGENYSSPAQGSSDAVIAFALEDGAIRWIRQTTKDDAWNLACMPFIPDHANCPPENGPDVDFASPPLMLSVNGRDLLVAGQKSGAVHGIDPASGQLVWSRQIGRGGNQGGVHFGMASNGATVFVPMSDYDDDMLPPEAAKPGLFGLRPATGEVIWTAPADNVCGSRKDCDPGISAAITAIPGVVFAGHMDGRLRAYASESGEVIWETNTDRPYSSISGAPARGGSFGGGSGPMIVDGVVYANSGYGLYFHMPGNVLLAFSIDGF